MKTISPLPLPSTLPIDATQNELSKIESEVRDLKPDLRRRKSQEKAALVMDMLALIEN